jgi:hypothetical protein
MQLLREKKVSLSSGRQPATERSGTSLGCYSYHGSLVPTTLAAAAVTHSATKSMVRQPEETKLLCHPVTTHKSARPTVQYSFRRFKLPLLTSGPWSQGPLRCGGEAMALQLTSDWTCHLRPLLSPFHTRSRGRFL